MQLGARKPLHEAIKASFAEEAHAELSSVAALPDPQVPPPSCRTPISLHQGHV